MGDAIQLVVGKGCFLPADGRNQGRLREFGLGMGEIVHAKIERPRNPRFMRKAHALGRLCRENIEGFESLTDHQALKRLQYESGVSCENMTAKLPGAGMVEIRVPKSINFSDMDDAEFADLYQGIAKHIATHYWPDMEPEQIERIAELID